MPKKEYIVTVEERRPRKSDDGCFGFALYVVPGVALVMAVLFRVFGVTWEQWPALRWITIVSAIVVVLVLSPMIVGWIRKKSQRR